MGELVGPTLDVVEGASHVFINEVLAVAPRVDGLLEQICDIEH
jgi:hypothetical protein